MKKVAILAAPGFEEIELMAPLDILRRLNMDVVLAGVQSDKVVSTHEVTVSTDTMLDKLHADKLDALILPGGAGSWVLRDTPEVIHLVKKMHEAGKLVAAICAAPIVLAKAGLVKDRNVTAYPAQDVYRELNEAGARYSIILFMWPPLHLSPANGRLMEKPPEGGGPMESAEDMLCRLFAFLRKQTRRLILLSSPPSDYGSARHPYAEEPGALEAWNALLRTLAGKLNLPFIDFCGDMLQCRPLPGSGEEDFPEAYRNLGKQVLHRLPFGQTWVRRRSGKIHRLLEKRRKRRKERMLARWRTLAAPPHYREETDWITAIHSEKGQARILLIGGSVMRHLWRPLASELQEDIDLFSSTLIPGDPDYLPTLAGYFPSAGYEAVIVSFGSHVTNKVSAISVDDFRKNYMAFVSQLSKRCRFLILATSTSIMDGPDGTLNEEKEKIITAFNAIVREAASSLPGAVLSDHHDFMQGRRYIDPFHFSPPDRAYQAGKTAGLLLPLLSARQEPPKEQECPKSRPEP